MADIELIIKIPEEMYKWAYDVNKFSNDYGMGDFIDLIKNGILLPKGHGRLIDADELTKQLETVASDDWNKQVGASKGLEDAIDIVDDAQAIIEADKAESEEV